MVCIFCGGTFFSGVAAAGGAMRSVKAFPGDPVARGGLVQAVACTFLKINFA